MSPEPDIRVIYGGTFDPFHMAHESVCRTILDQPLVRELRLIPCALPALKAQASASSDERLAMLKAWRASQTDSNRIVVDDIEIRRDGISYTLDTIKALQKDVPQASWIFALGADAWNSVLRWHGGSQLLTMLSFWVFQRAGVSEIQHHSVARVSDSFQNLISAPGQYWIDASVQMPMASSELRAADDRKLTTATPKAVSDYINQHGLYQTVSSD